VAKSQEIVLALDTGALINAERDQRIQATVMEWVRNGAVVLIPAVAIAEAVRGSARDANINRLIKAVGRIDSLDERLARQAGDILASQGKGISNDTVDAIVVATALAAGAKNIVTSDPDDIERLGGGALKAIPV
jgi:predicted nucleic acid-binding protein